MPHLLWTDEPRVTAGMSLRADGDMRLRTDGGAQDDVLLRRRTFLSPLLPGVSIAAPLPVHGVRGARVTGSEPLQGGHALFPSCDALVTSVPGIVLTVTAADCLPVHLFDPVRGAIGLAHAGWRGLVAAPQNVLAATVEALAALGSRPQDLRVVIGPSIGPCHYVVDAELRQRFADRFGADVAQDDALDLRRAATVALVAAGVDAASIAADPPCTACHADRFFSHRVDRRDPPLAGMAWLAMRRPR